MYSTVVAEEEVLGRLERAIAMSKVVVEEYKTVRLRILMLGIECPSSVESLLAHIEIDLDFLSKEFKQIRG